MFRKTQTYLKGGIIIMLKKVMIICLAFSFVFIGGIAFASGNGPEPPQEEGQDISSESTHSSGDVTLPAEPTDLITDDAETLLEEGTELKDKALEEDDNGQH